MIGIFRWLEYFPLAGANKGFEKVDTVWGSGNDRVNMGREDEMCVDSIYQYVESPFYR